jgi:hypothetical protein
MRNPPNLAHSVGHDGAEIQCLSFDVTPGVNIIVSASLGDCWVRCQLGGSSPRQPIKSVSQC